EPKSTVIGTMNQPAVHAERMTKTDSNRRCYEKQHEGAPSKIQRPADQGCYSHACEPERFPGCPVHATSLSIGHTLVEHSGRSEGALRSCQCTINRIKALCRSKSDGLCEIHRHRALPTKPLIHGRPAALLRPCSLRPLLTV